MFREVERFREVEKDLILRNYFKQTRKDDFDPDKRIIVKEEKDHENEQI